MGEMFIIFEVLFLVGLLKTDASGQPFFFFTEQDHFPVSLPQLTKVDTWENQANWRLDTTAHRRAIESNPVQGEFSKRNMQLCVPNFDPENDSVFNAIDEYHEGGEHSYAQGSGRRRNMKRKKNRRKLRATAAATGETAAEVERILKRSFKPAPPPN